VWIWSSYEGCMWGCLGTKSRWRTWLSCEKPRGAASRLWSGDVL